VNSPNRLSFVFHGIFKFSEAKLDTNLLQGLSSPATLPPVVTSMLVTGSAATTS
jgi:hypothetical protein